jgi:hypothetical protein
MACPRSKPWYLEEGACTLCPVLAWLILGPADSNAVKVRSLLHASCSVLHKYVLLLDIVLHGVRAVTADAHLQQLQRLLQPAV